MDDIKIRLALDGADAVQAGANKVAAGLDKIGQSGQKVTASLSGQQMAQVSAQLQDFFVQVQGGQAPLTALLQQGSQLSAVFGGVGNAARAVASLITPAVAGLSALAAVVGGAGLAYVQGAKEAEAYTRGIVLSGNAAGVTVGQLKALAQAQAQVVGTQGDAAKSLAALAETGQISSLVLDKASEAVTRFTRVGGDFGKTVDKFADLGKDPLSAIVKINEAENFLTESVYKQIKALTEQNRLNEAATLAQSTYADVLSERTKKIEASLGSLETAWKKVKDVAGGAWDAMLNVGRPATLQDQIKDVQAQIEAAQAKVAAARSGSLKSDKPWLDTERVAAAQERLVVSLQSTAAALSKKLDIERLNAAAEGERAASIKNIIAADKDAEKNAKALNRELEQRAQLLAELSGLNGDFSKDWERLSALYKSNAISLEQLTQAQAALLAKQPGIAAYQKAEIEGAKAIAEARAALRRADDKAVDAFLDQQRAQTEALLQGIRDRIVAVNDENAAAVVARTQNIALSDAIALVTLRRLEDKAAQLNEGSGAEQAISREIALRKQLADAQSLKSLNDFLDPNRAQTFGEALTGAFEQAGNSLAKLSGALNAYGKTQRDIAANMARLDSEKDPFQRTQKAIQLQTRAQEANVQLFASMTGAAKGFFAENTRGYKALEAAENAFRLVQLASDLQKGLSAAAVGVANQAQGDPFSAFPRMAAMAAIMAGLGFAVGGFGGGGGSSGGGDGAPQATGQGTVLGDATAKSESIARATEQLASTAQLQLTTQSGMLAAMRNIESNIGGLAALVVRGNTLADSGVQQGTTLSLADPFSRGLFAKVGDTITTKIYEALFGKKVSVTGQGLAIDAARLGAVADGGSLNVSNYTDVNSKQKFFGITVSNRNSTNYSPADPVLQQQFSQVFKDLYAGIISASTPLGLALDQVQGRLDNFVLNIGKIELKDLTAAQIQEKLQAVIGAAADNIATAAIPGLEAFQKVGEGYFETIVRVASGVETAQDALARLGLQAVGFADLTRKQGDVAAEIVRQSITTFETVGGKLSSVGGLIGNFDAGADDLASTYQQLVGVRDMLIALGLSGESLTAKLIQGAGSLDGLASSLQTYLAGPFFSDTERAAAAMSTLQAQFARLGIDAVPQSYAGFRALVDGIDVSTAAGQLLRGQVIGLADAFDAAQKAADKAGTSVTAAASRLPDILKSQGTERDGLLVDLLKAQGDAVGAAALKRSQDLATLTAGLTAAEAAAAIAGYDYLASLRGQIDEANKLAQTAAAAATQRAGIQARIDDLAGDVAASRARELLGLDASNRALQEHYYALLDQKAAADAAAQAAQALADKERTIAAERDGIQARIDELQGNTTAMRARELLGLDEANRALQEHYYALSDQKTAAEAAAQAAQALADKERAVAAERDGIQARIDELQGNTTAMRARELLGLDEANRALQEHYFALLDQKTAAEAAAQAAQDLADKQRAIAAERDGIQARIDELRGDTAAIRARELLGLDESNRALQENYFALLDAKAAQDAANQASAEAARAAEQLRDAWRSIGDTLVEEAQRILGLNTANDAQSLALAQAKFASTTSLARAGDQDSAKALPELARTVLQLVGDTATSRIELDRARAQVAASLQGTAGVLGGLFGFSTKGASPAVDVQGLLAQIAATAPITSAGVTQQQAAAAAQDNLSALVQEVKALSAKVDVLQGAANRSAAADERTRDLLIQVTDNGQAMAVDQV